MGHLETKTTAICTRAQATNLTDILAVAGLL
jgi:hypothetical protein